MVIEALLRRAVAQLATVSPSAKLDAVLLLAHGLGVSRSWLYSHPQQPLTPEAVAEFERLLQRRLNGEPVSYILGVQAFWSLPFTVNADVLIPRPESELLVEQALARFSAQQPRHIADLGCGSGAIGLAIAHERRQWRVTLVDNSAAALAVAKQNGTQLQLGNVRYVMSDWCQQLTPQSFDLIVSNPPYIGHDDPHLQQGDLRFEPLAALAAEQQGLAALQHIISQAGNYLLPQGWLLLEQGYQQAQAVAACLRQHHFVAIRHYRDLLGIERVTVAQWLG